MSQLPCLCGRTVETNVPPVLAFVSSRAAARCGLRKKKVFQTYYGGLYPRKTLANNVFFREMVRRTIRPTNCIELRTYNTGSCFNFLERFVFIYVVPTEKKTEP